MLNLLKKSSEDQLVKLAGAGIAAPFLTSKHLSGASPLHDKHSAGHFTQAPELVTLYPEYTSKLSSSKPPLHSEHFPPLQTEHLSPEHFSQMPFTTP
jgi:hypothetical protein